MMRTRKNWVFLLVHFILNSALVLSDDSEIQSLLKFKDSLTNNTALKSWSNLNNPCTGNNPNWKGLLCSNNSVFGLQLENMGLSGEINIDALAQISTIRSVSFMNNSLGGQFPDVKKLGRAFRNKKAEPGKLCFLKEERERFELLDLLKASAEVLGSGSFGSSYKASLLTGPAMVVKRFRHMSNVGKEEFQMHMSRIGRLSHPNLLPLVAFYYKKEEKLLVTDFVENGSLASHLHGKRTPERKGLDWPMRLNIIKGVAKGLSYLYQELPNLTLPHGHLKSSNVLLNESFEPVLGDYALAPVVNKDHAQQFMVAYKSPEFTDYDRTTKQTDVWSLGILILEMLTGGLGEFRGERGVDR